MYSTEKILVPSFLRYTAHKRRIQPGWRRISEQGSRAVTGRGQPLASVGKNPQRRNFFRLIGRVMPAKAVPRKSQLCPLAVPIMDQCDDHLSVVRAAQGAGSRRDPPQSFPVRATMSRGNDGLSVRSLHY
jgi:hypothetical protein